MKKVTKPTYIKLYEQILKSIESKEYNVSEKLPSENELAKQFDVNRHTVRQALSLLKDKGFIYTKRGKGNFISNIKVPYSITDKSSYSSKILDLGYEPKTKLLSANIVEPSEDVINNLGLSKKLKVIELKLLRYANDLPISVSYSYFDAFIYREIINNLDMEPFSLYKILNKCYPNLEIRKVSTVFESLVSTKEFSKLLMMPSNSPILAASTLSKDQDGNFVEYGTSYFRADTCKIKVDLI
ncbi:GntR family transcriptional regulator [Arcobacter roscoffensis]|uniref:GntR family transcriptional regulator n=1 Tax=Arcobacter roscoffensis TaxID=2961520 RepID=A0ABY5E1S2_9BACT|nr:GntR family transcriptional regulator [Arcobacter roscoffensis]UTJ05080.1 GntR family transcriptional regulator [Arcobacter roscoffensis]